MTTALVTVVESVVLRRDRLYEVALGNGMASVVVVGRPGDEWVRQASGATIELGEDLEAEVRRIALDMSRGRYRQWRR